MRTFFLTAAAVFASAALSGCFLTDGPVLPDTNEDLTSGVWEVSYFFDKTEDETGDFDGYSFEFRTDQTFAAQVPGGATVLGSWSRTTDDGKPRLVIRISGTERLEELDDDWVLTRLDSLKIELEDDNRTEIEKLHFSKR